MRPIIGISAGRRLVKSSEGKTRATVLYTTYSEMVRATGGIPVVLPPGDPAEIPELIARLDGLILSGGGDVEPALYGGEHLDGVYAVDPVRDAFELALVRAAVAQRLPTLAICRGMQIANVALGGTLFEDIATRRPQALAHQVKGEGVREPQHAAYLDSGSSLAQAIGDEVAKVNSIHHQALDDVAAVFRVVGTAPDGIVEAVEPTNDDWPMWGVQWHPEYLGAGDPASRRLFAAFVDRAAG